MFAFIEFYVWHSQSLSTLYFCNWVKSYQRKMPPVEIIDIGKLEEGEAKQVLERLDNDDISSVCSEEVRENLSKLLELNLSSIFEVDEVKFTHTFNVFFLLFLSHWE